MKKYLIILLVGIISFLKIDNVSAAYTPSVSYANDAGEVILTCYSDNLFSACHTGNNGTVSYNGAEESAYKDIDTAPDNICYMSGNGETVISSQYTCDEIIAEDWWAEQSTKQYLHKMEDVALSQCEYHFQEIGTESMINHNIYFELDSLLIG